MKIVSVNVGLPREVVWKGITVQTAIFKEPVTGAVAIRELNLAGGPAGGPHGTWWIGQGSLRLSGRALRVLGKQLADVSLPWGAFGENLTTEGLWEDALCIGDLLSVGSAVLLVTQPRLPCYKLELRFNPDDMIKRFLASGRSGFYFSVVEPGEVSAGSEVEIVSRDPKRVTVTDVLKLYLNQTRDPGLIQRAANVRALPRNWKAALLRARTD